MLQLRKTIVFSEEKCLSNFGSLVLDGGNIEKRVDKAISKQEEQIQKQYGINLSKNKKKKKGHRGDNSNSSES